MALLLQLYLHVVSSLLVIVSELWLLFQKLPMSPSILLGNIILKFSLEENIIFNVLAQAT